MGFPRSQANCNSKNLTANNHVQLAKAKWCPSSINLQTPGKLIIVSTCTKAMVDAILLTCTAQKAMDLQVATNISERQLIEFLMHLLSTFGWHFASVMCVQEFILGFIFIFNRVQLMPKPVVYCLATAEFIDRVFSLRCINKDESKIKISGSVALDSALRLRNMASASGRQENGGGL